MRISDWSSDVCSSDLAAAVHRGIAAAEHQHALADPSDGAEVDVGQPVEADVDVRRAFPAPGQVEVAPARGAAADEDGVEVLRKQFLHRIDAPVADELDAQVEDVAAFLVDHLLGQAETRSEEHKSDLQPLLRLSYAV